MCAHLHIATVLNDLENIPSMCVISAVDREELSGKLALSLLVMMGFNVGFVFLATFLTCFEVRLACKFIISLCQNFSASLSIY